jgi:hypothetical protein
MRACRRSHQQHAIHEYPTTMMEAVKVATTLRKAAVLELGCGTLQIDHDHRARNGHPRGPLNSVSQICVTNSPSIAMAKNDGDTRLRTQNVNLPSPT